MQRIEIMKNEILVSLNNPAQLEKLYHTDKTSFKRAFQLLYPDLKEHALVSFWNERLHFNSGSNVWRNRHELLFVIVASIIAGIMSRLPALFNIDADFFYPRNMGFILFPALMAFFAWQQRLSKVKLLILAGALLVSVVFINYFPDKRQSDTLVLSCIHLLVVLWALTGLAFAGNLHHSQVKRLDYLKYNGDLVVITALILIAGAILSGITIGLFSLIGYSIEQFYMENIAVAALPAAPILGTYLIQNNPQLVGKVSPVIAKIFSPLVLLMLLIYLVAMAFSGKDPYNNREFLMLFNALLLGVMAIIFFSIAETTPKNKAEIWILTLLALVTIIVNSIALSAIVFRISEWGFTPNRTAVLGGNVLILGNLLLVMVQLLKVIFQKADLSRVEKAITSYLPVYFAWAVFVTFLLPLLFGFK